MVDDRARRFDIAIVTYNTAAYLLRLIRSIAAVLPSGHVAAVHVWDNGSSDCSELVLDALASDCPWLRLHRSAGNMHHGPALDALLRACCSSPWVLLLDSDTEVRRNFVPELPALDDRRDILVGQVSPWAAPLYFYLAHLLINRARYLELPPFVHDGAPGIDLFQAVHDRCLPYHRFRWCDFVIHAGQASLRAVVARGETDIPFSGSPNPKAVCLRYPTRAPVMSCACARNSTRSCPPVGHAVRPGRLHLCSLPEASFRGRALRPFDTRRVLLNLAEERRRSGLPRAKPRDAAEPGIQRGFPLPRE